MLLYNIIIALYGWLIQIAALFNTKAKLWINGRKNVWDQLSQKIQPQQEYTWFHCASLGEFEQGRPVMEAMRRHFPHKKILLTFFSPSGYEVRKHYAGADIVLYLPLDKKENAQRFIKMTQPGLVIFIKYEFWYHYINELEKQRIPILLISAIFRKDQVFFKWYGSLFRKMLKSYSHIFVQDETSRELLSSLNINNITIAGDTRFDRVKEMAAEEKPLPAIEAFAKGRRLLIAGSTWPEDEQLLADYYFSQKGNCPVVIAPHEIHEAHLERIEELFENNSIRYSALLKGASYHPQQTVLIIDNIGLLSALYRFGFAAYIGGGFTNGIHNILEAAVYGIPVIFGPKYEKFREAREMVSAKAAFPVHNKQSLSAVFTQLSNDNFLKAAGERAGNYVNDNTGATDKIINYIQEKRFLTNE